jgi:hypothetical protein
VVGPHSDIDGSISSHFLSSQLPNFAVHHVHNAQPTSQLPPLLLPPDTTTHSCAYKKVANKVRPVTTTLPEDFCNIRRIHEDPLLTLPPLPMHPPDLTPGECLTQEHLDTLGLNADGFLQPEEEKLLVCILKMNEMGLAWTEAEKGRFRDEYFSPVKIPVIEHTPWAHKNLPIPPGILHEVIKIFKDKSVTGSLRAFRCFVLLMLVPSAKEERRSPLGPRPAAPQRGHHSQFRHHPHR